MSGLSADNEVALELALWGASRMSRRAQILYIVIPVRIPQIRTSASTRELLSGLFRQLMVGYGKIRLVFVISA
jgi:hypothetical protein